MERMLVISDIHGELEKWESLLELVNYDPSVDQLILLGDYVDRGPASKGVLDKVMELHAKGAIVLMGNHDHMMIKSFEQDQVFIERWFRNGAYKTMESYGHPAAEQENGAPQTLELTAELKQHLSFLKGLQCYHETEEYIFVHGGVHPTTPIHETDPYTLMWIREEFHKGYKGEKTVVFGHTPTEGLHGKNDVYFGENNIIGIDGGAVFGGQLNCLELPSKKVYSVK
ncbi:serine/threonine protein phosphatase [Brevibacillus nitrificans]|uniref:Serine/threonine protein phosphatase n=1 Tax=Brevibacillus nitrificans TaxID=651560 RepID=A0A3M8DJP2_9BACL|nr:metallophosphoesterase family protein [Brevibacillus nitrificans]RNB88266.1 serine/threonine protein phosphatase [Brevibacillus nitrificans]